MANDEHVRILRQGVEAWNQWRRENPRTEPHLSGATLSDADLSDANLYRADLGDADLVGADLSRAALRGADLVGAHLYRTNLSDMDLTEPVGLATVQHREPIFPGVQESPLPYPAPFLKEARPLNKVDSAKSETTKEQNQIGVFSSLEIIGQILGCYLVCASPRGMALIDQHAAHERVAFEKMRYQLDKGEVERQSLLIPQVLELPVAEAALLEQRLNVIEHLGFTVEEFGPNAFAIKAVPVLLPPGDYREVMRGMIAEFAEVGESTELQQELEERLATIACHSVIRANRRLEIREIQALLSELDQIDFATQCPHGRPVLLEFTQEQLEKMFKRT